MAPKEGGSPLEDLTASLRKQLTETGGGAGNLSRGMRQSSGLSYEQKLKRYEDAITIARPFMEGSGPDALQLLRQRTIEQSTWPWQHVTGDQILAWGCAREGQNSIVRFIEEQIEVARKGPPVEDSSDGE